MKPKAEKPTQVLVSALSPAQSGSGPPIGGSDAEEAREPMSRVPTAHAEIITLNWPGDRLGLTVS